MQSYIRMFKLQKWNYVYELRINQYVKKFLDQLQIWKFKLLRAECVKSLY